MVAVPAQAADFRGIPFGSSGESFSPTQLSQVDHLDLDGYQGTWHQVAVIPQLFNLQCQRDTTATYTLLDPQLVGVKNRCTTFTGRRSGVDGAARVTDPATGASLRVAFDNIPFQNIDGPTNYRVTWMSENKDVAIIGSPNRSNGYVLSRSRALSGDSWATVKKIITDRGWNTCQFVTTPVTGGYGAVTPLCLKK